MTEENGGLLTAYNGGQMTEDNGSHLFVLLTTRWQMSGTDDDDYKNWRTEMIQYTL